MSRDDDSGSPDTVEDSRLAVRRGETAQLGPGARIGDYTIHRRIGRGGFGMVFEVEHALGRRAALKLLAAHHASSPTSRARFEREARVLRELAHPNIVETYELGATPTGQPFLAMELLEGNDLDAHLRVRGRLAVTELLDIALPLCSALAAAHDAGVIHRDIKPSNIFLASHPLPRVVLLDFGLAKPFGAIDLTRADQRVGTPGHMSPEQLAQRPLDARSDIYQLGITLFRMLTGRLPEPGESATPSRFAPAISEAIDAIIIKTLRTDPAQRYPNVRALATALRAATTPAAATSSLARPTLALHLEIASTGTAEQLDITALVGDRLAALGLSIAASAGNALVLVRTIAGDAAPLVADLRSAVADLTERARDHGLVLRAAVHTGEARWADGRCVGGPLLVLDWVRAASGRA